MKHDSFSESAEMYLKTVSELAVGGNPVPISALAGRLGVSPVSATEMVHRLQDYGLVDHRPYKGIVLTTDGAKQASEIIRSHRLWERFLADCLGLPWNDVHALACRLEHATDPKVTSALDRFLGYPTTCPHGNPIPDVDDAVRESPQTTLSDLRPGEAAIITRVHPETDELLDYLFELGLTAGTRVVMREIVPFHGPLVLQIRDELCYLAPETATNIFIELIEDPQ